MPTNLDLVNQALNEMGQARIPSLDNTNNSALVDTANFQLARVKKAVLRVRDWNCARKRRELDALDAGLSLGEWSLAYRLPPDCVAVRRFVSTCPETAHAPFSVERDPDDKPILFTNCGNNKIVYTALIDDVNRWDPLLFDACASRLAVQFAITLNKDLKFLQSCWQAYQMKIEEAAGVDEAESGVERVIRSDFVGVRF